MNTVPVRAKKDGEQAIGPSRGGLSTKIHAPNSVELMLSSGQAGDLTCAAPLLESSDRAALIGHKANDADAVIKTLADSQITPVQAGKRRPVWFFRARSTASVLRPESVVARAPPKRDHRIAPALAAITLSSTMAPRRLDDRFRELGRGFLVCD